MDALETFAPNPAVLTTRQENLVVDAVLEARAPSTRRAYAAAVARFEKWAGANGSFQPLPAEPRTVAAHLAELADEGLSISSITISAAALKAWHLDGGHRDPTSNRGVTSTLAGLRRKLGTAPKRQARAFDLGELKRMLSALDRDTTAGRRDAALLLLAYSSAMRRSELVALTRADLQLRPEGIRVAIRRSKTNQDGAAEHIGVPAGTTASTDPLRAVRQWLGVRGGCPSDPVFTRVSRSGAVLPGGLSGQSVNLILQRAAEKAGLDLHGISGHSTRVSHITSAAAAGVSLEQIMRTSRHRSHAVAAGYVRSALLLEDSSAASLGL